MSCAWFPLRRLARTPRWYGWIAAILTLLSLLSAPRAAFAHASLLSASPAEGVTLPTAPATLHLEFNEPVSPMVMRLVRPTGQITDLQDVTTLNQSVTIKAPSMADAGSYALSWRVISADGHPVGGVVSFAIGHPSAREPVAQSEANVHVVLWIVEFILSTGLFVGVGGIFCRMWLEDAGSSFCARLLAALVASGVIAAVVSIPLQGLDALARPLRQILQPSVWQAGFGTSWGTTVALSVGTCAAALVALASQDRLLQRGLSAVALAGVGCALVASGHASTAEPRWLAVPAVFLHSIGVAFWVGALLPLSLALRNGDRVTLKRFSLAIPLPLMVLIGAGIVLALIQLDRPDALWTTDYGRVLSVKLAIVCVLLELAAVNRYALVPRVSTAGTRRLVAVIATELVLAVFILALVGLWRFTPPPRALAAAEMTYIHFHGERAMAQIELKPVRGRGASLDIEVTDGDLLPVAAKAVDIVIWNPSAGIEPIRASAAFHTGASWTVEGLRIPVAGVWRMRVELLVSDFDKVMIEDNVVLPLAP